MKKRQAHAVIRMEQNGHSTLGEREAWSWGLSLRFELSLKRETRNGFVVVLLCSATSQRRFVEKILAARRDKLDVLTSCTKDPLLKLQGRLQKWGITGHIVDLSTFRHVSEPRPESAWKMPWWELPMREEMELQAIRKALEPLREKSAQPQPTKAKVEIQPMVEEDAELDDLRFRLRKVARRALQERKRAVVAAEEWALSHNLADTVSYSGVAPWVAEEWNLAVKQTLDDLPVLRPMLKFLGTTQEYKRKYGGIWLTNPRPWAFASHRGIMVRKSLADDPIRFLAALDRCVARQFHPPGCNTVKSICDHELGHLVDWRFDLSENKKIVTEFRRLSDRSKKEQLSKYACRNICEFVAEAWAELRNNPQPRRIARLVGIIVFEESDWSRCR
ncbi:MAG: hypothetical protein KatS3mg105_3225 [Gemmatales bacterium]|nr:MAG: hypothetical protein KatS3mg105_3225 [Gemmatales bacterium]